MARNKAEMDEIVETRPAPRRLWNEVKDRLTGPAPACPAASSSVCALPAPSRPRPKCC